MSSDPKLTTDTIRLYALFLNEQLRSADKAIATFTEEVKEEHEEELESAVKMLKRIKSLLYDYLRLLFLLEPSNPTTKALVTDIFRIDPAWHRSPSQEPLFDESEAITIQRYWAQL